MFALKKYTPYLIISILVMVIYWPSLSGDFIFDDNMLIKNNPYIKSLHNVSSYLTQEDGIVDETDKVTLHTGYYRPLLNFTYYIDYRIWGMDAFGFRLTNILLHLICCLLIFQLLLRLKIDQIAALLGTTFFAVNPINSETISMIVCRNNLLATIFSVLSLISYIESRRGWQFNIFFSMLFFLLALLSKEVALMILPVFFLYNRLVDAQDRNISRELLSYLPFLLIVIIYLMIRSQVIGGFISPFGTSNTLTRLFFIPYLIIYNLFLIFVPYGLHSFYVKYPASYLGYEAILSDAFLLLLIVALWMLRKYKLLIFSISAFVISMFPVMHIIPFASPSLITMRWIYFPLAFLSIAVAYGFKSATAFKKNGIFVCIPLIFFMYLGTYTFVLNDTLWKNNRSFLNIEVLQFNNILFAHDLAKEMQSEGKYQEAERLYLVALQAFPNKAQTYIDYAALLINTGRFQNAKEYLDKSHALVMMRDDRCLWYTNMSVAFLNLHNIPGARTNLEKAIQLCPENPNFRRRLQYIDKLESP